MRSTRHMFFGIWHAPWWITLIVQSESISTDSIKNSMEMTNYLHHDRHTETKPSGGMGNLAGHQNHLCILQLMQVERTQLAFLPPIEILRWALIGVHSPKQSYIFPPAVIPFPAPHTSHRTRKESKQRVVCSSITAIILLWLFTVLILQWSREEQVTQAVQEAWATEERRNKSQSSLTPSDTNYSEWLEHSLNSVGNDDVALIRIIQMSILSSEG